MVSFTLRPLYPPGSAGMDDVERRKFLPYWDSNSDPSIVEPVGS
jgi:hypothetical protein